MNRKKGLLAAMLALSVMCVCLMAGCGSSTEDESTDTGSTENEDTSENEAAEDIIGKVTYADSSIYFSVKEYTSSTVVDDYASLDVSSLTATDTTKTINTDSNAEYFKVNDGTLVSAERGDIQQGNIIASTTSDDNVQQIIILSDECDEAIDAEIAEVTAVNNDGELSLILYSLTDAAREDNYEIMDASNVEMDNYQATEETKEYTIPENAKIVISENGSLTEGVISEIVVGDLLVIYADSDEKSDSGLTITTETDAKSVFDNDTDTITIVIYHSSSE